MYYRNVPIPYYLIGDNSSSTKGKVGPQGPSGPPGPPGPHGRSTTGSSTTGKDGAKM